MNGVSQKNPLWVPNSTNNFLWGTWTIIQSLCLTITMPRSRIVLNCLQSYLEVLGKWWWLRGINTIAKPVKKRSTLWKDKCNWNHPTSREISRSRSSITTWFQSIQRICQANHCKIHSKILRVIGIIMLFCRQIRIVTCTSLMALR